MPEDQNVWDNKRAVKLESWKVAANSFVFLVQKMEE